MPRPAKAQSMSIERDKFHVATAMSYVMQRLAEDKKILLLELHKNLEERDILYQDNVLSIGVGKPFSLSMFVKFDAMNIYNMYIKEIYDIAMVQFVLSKNVKHISQDIEYVKTIMGDCPVTVIK